jgi:hypothetical protein
MINLTYTSVYNIIARLYRDVDSEMINESDIIEWIGDALDHIGSVEYTQLSTAFVEVENFKCDVPDGCVDVLQIVKRNGKTPDSIQEVLDECDCLDLDNKPQQQEEQDKGERLDSCGQPVILDCNGMPIEDYELAYYRPYFDYVYWYFDPRRTYYNGEWSIVRLAQHNFFHSVRTNPKLKLHENKGLDEYNIVDNVMHFSFDKGYVAISYYKRVYDKDGYPMIPDEVSILSAITEYCKYKMFQKLWYKGRDGMKDKWEVAENNYQWYTRQAKSKAKQLNAEQLNQLTNYMTTLLPRNNYWNQLNKTYGLPEDVKYVKNTAYYAKRTRQFK